MATENYTEMTNQELVATVNAFNKRPDQLVRFLSKSYPMILNEIYHRTEFLNTTKKCTIQTRLYCFNRSIDESSKSAVSTPYVFSMVFFVRSFLAASELQHLREQYRAKLCV